MSDFNEVILKFIEWNIFMPDMDGVVCVIMMTSLSYGTFSALLAFCWGKHRSSVDWTKVWANERDAGDLRRHCSHYDITVIIIQIAYIIATLSLDDWQRMELWNLMTWRQLGTVLLCTAITQQELWSVTFINILWLLWSNKQWMCFTDDHILVKYIGTYCALVM